MSRLFSMRSAGMLLVVVALCAVTAGCVSDIDAASSGVTSDNGGGTMRYYGGPKYPMWSSNQ
jgi:hypothetical protein